MKTKIFTTGKDKKVVFVQQRLIEFLAANGFRKEVEGNEKCSFKKINGSLVEETNHIKMKEFISRYLQEKKEVRALQKFYEEAERLIDPRKLEMLPTMDGNYLKDTKGVSYHAFKNGMAVVTADKIDFITHDAIEDKRLIRSMIDREYKVFAGKSEFEVFIENAMGKEEHRKMSLITALGYLIHNYHNPSVTKAVILTDEELNDADEANGGTGKSLTTRALKEFLCGSPFVINEDARNFSAKKTFAFQRLSNAVRLMIFNDAAPDFSFESFYSILTDGITFEKKYKGAERLEPHQLPKMLITTNYLVKGHAGDTHERRVHEIEFSTHYGANNRPQDEFGHLLFDEWNAEEWNRFDLFMLECVRIYLKNGLLGYPKVNLWKKKMVALGGSAVIDFLEAYFSNIFKEGIIKTVRINKAELFQDFAGKNSGISLTPKRFKNLIDIYLLGLGLKFNHLKSNGSAILEILE